MATGGLELNGYIHDLRFDALPDEVVTFAKRCVLDLCGVAVGALPTELSCIIRDHAVTHFGAGAAADSPRAHILFDGRTLSPAGASLAGGMTIDALDAHDGHRLTKGHAGCSAFPSALAFAEATGLTSGREFLTWVVLGYEIGTRAGMALHETACDYHTSGAWGAVACAAIGSRALGLDAQKTRHALGIAEYHGPRSQMMRCIDHPTMLKDGSGWGAHAGVSAAYLAEAGFTGAPALTVEEERVGDLWADLGQRWHLLEQYFKAHPVCRWAQPAVEAALALLTQESDALSAERVVEIEIHTFHEAVRLGAGHPETTEEAQYSLAFPVAAAIANKRLGPAEVQHGSLGDPRIARLIDTTRLVEDSAYNDAFPHRRYAHVIIRLDDGRELTSARTEPRGDPEAHLHADEMIDKFHQYADPLLGVERSTAVEQSISQLDTDEPADLARFVEAVTSEIS